MNKKALLIGINYKGTENELYGCINDIHNIKTFLIEKCDYLPENITVLTDDEENKPTCDNIKNNINLLVKDNKENDTMLFYYSGHGSYVKDTNKDESDRKDEVIVPLDYETSDFITDDWLFTNMISKVSKNATLLCFTDCCHSGTIMDLKYNSKSQCRYKKPNLSLVENYIPSDWSNNFALNIEPSKDVKNGYVVLFSGCQDSETSEDAYIESKGTSEGAFTFCLLETLNNNLDKNNKYKPNKLLLKNVLKEVNCRLDIHGYKTQNTQLSTGKLVDLEKYLNF